MSDFNKQINFTENNTSFTAERKKLIYKSTRNIAAVYLLIALLTDRMSVFTSLCAGLPFVIPVITAEPGTAATDRIIKSFAFGVAGTLLSIAVMLITDTYSLVTWSVPALLGFSFCVLFIAVKKHLSDRASATARSLMLVAILWICFI